MNSSNPATASIPKSCPGLSCDERGARWRNSIGQEFDLATEKLLSVGEVALATRRSTEWVLRKIREGELYPVVFHNARLVEVYACAVTDLRVRHIGGGSSAAA
jgi:hypothetical protein